MLFYALIEEYFGHPGNPDAGRVEQQLAADRVRIVARGRRSRHRGQWQGRRESGCGEDAPPRNAEPEEMCLAWERLPAAEADRLASSL